MAYISLTELAAFQAKNSEDFTLTQRKKNNKNSIHFNFPRKILKALGVIKGDRLDILFDIPNGEGTIKRSNKGYSIIIDKNGRGSIGVTYRPGLPKPKEPLYKFEYFVDGTTNEILFTFNSEIFNVKED